MDIALLVKQRLAELHLDQKDLAEAVDVTESYVSQLLGRKKAPPSPSRTDLYEKIGQFLKLPGGELASMAQAQRQAELKKKLAQAPGPLFKDSRQLVLRKCDSGTRAEIRGIFEKEPFGELERLITQKILDVAQEIARDELRNDDWLRSLARVSGRTFEEMRVASLEFMDTDVFQVSTDGCVNFLDPMIDSWDIDLKTFSIEIVLNSRLAPARVKRFEFLEVAAEQPEALEPGFVQFLKDRSMSGDISEEEIEFLRRLKFTGRRPSPLYYYRELQNFRDPLHFSTAGARSTRTKT